MSEEVSSEIKCGLLGMLRLCCLREEFLQVLTHTKDNKIITYLARIEHLPPIEQKEIVKLVSIFVLTLYAWVEQTSTASRTKRYSETG